MTLNYTVTTDLFCDGCGCHDPDISVVDGRKAKLAEVRRRAKARGWLVVREDGKERSYCPKCQQKSEEAE